ncbi:hypothetical protein FOA52_005535 [Chlamydomonas sp. UWO 241]|nr:hypothetical protein FOA52_005535 [Chlamydomonas sp. UWO 241]
MAEEAAPMPAVEGDEVIEHAVEEPEAEGGPVAEGEEEGQGEDAATAEEAAADEGELPAPEEGEEPAPEEGEQPVAYNEPVPEEGGEEPLAAEEPMAAEEEGQPFVPEEGGDANTEPAAEEDAPPAAEEGGYDDALAPAEPEAYDAAPAMEEAPVGGMGDMLAGLGGATVGAPGALPIRQYLDTTVVPVLRMGLRELVKARPDDPYEFLANYIRANKPK